jgi:hypothetical protein
LKPKKSEIQYQKNIISREDAKKNHFHAEARRKARMCRHSRVLPRPKSLRRQAWRESSVVYYSHEGAVCEFTTPLKKVRSRSPRPLAGEGGYQESD